jgi:hypothetical protein
MTIHQVIVPSGTAAALATVAQAVAAAQSAASRLFIRILNFPIQALSIHEDMKLPWINFNGMYYDLRPLK